MVKCLNSFAKSVRGNRALPDGGVWSLWALSGARKYLTVAERRRFMVAAGTLHPVPRTFCLTLALTGCRISEALALRASDIETEQGFVAIRCLKKRGAACVRLVPVPCNFIRELRLAHHAAFDDPDDAGRLWPWGRTHGWEIVRDLMREAGVTGVAASAKGLRHSFGVHAVMSGVPLPLLQRWMGHASIETTTIYASLVGREERAMAQRMWEAGMHSG